jgi:hypothetical protein
MPRRSDRKNRSDARWSEWKDSLERIRRGHHAGPCIIFIRPEVNSMSGATVRGEASKGRDA